MRLRQHSRHRLILAFLTALFVTVAAGQAMDTDLSDGITVDTIVDEADDNVGDGICSDSLGRCTLRAAVQEANAVAGDHSILLPAGTFTLTVHGTGEDAAATGDLDITENLVITGAGSGSTTVDADGDTGDDRAFHLDDASGLGLVVTFEDLSIINGYVLNENGGGILVEVAEGGAPPLTLGEPAVKAEGSVVLTLRRVVVTGNTADSNTLDPEDKPVGGSGGGVYSAAELVLEYAQITANTAAANGGGFYAGGVVSLDSSLVSLNEAEGGAGIFETGSHISTYTNCAIVDNAAVGGGGISSRTQTTLQMQNCTLDGNTATDVGAGIQTNGTVNLVYSTVTDNASDSDAPHGGAGLNSFGSGSFRLWSTLVADNVVAAASTPIERNCGCTGTACTPLVQFLSLGHNLEDIDTCFFADPSDLPSTAPGLRPRQMAKPWAAVRPLATGSAAIDAGDAAICPATDQRGLTRPVDGDEDLDPQCDIGSVEFEPPLFADGFETGDTTVWSSVVGEV